MIRLIIGEEDIFLDNAVEVRSTASLKHLKALRPEIGEAVELLDGNGVVWRGRFARSGRAVVVRDIEKQAFSKRPPAVYLFVAVVQANKFDLIVDRAVEFGIDCLVPIFTDRTVFRPSNIEKRLMRWNRIAEEAMKQCANPFLLRIDGPMAFEDAVAFAKAHLSVQYIAALAHKDGVHLFDAIARNMPVEGLSVFIGPEGGFSERELDMARQAGAIPVSLGPNILRVEAAAAYACGIAGYFKAGSRR